MPARVAGFSERSGRVISTCECGFGEKDLGSGESLDDVHGALAERARPGSRLVQGRSLGLLAAAGGAEDGRVAAGFFGCGWPAEVADAGEASG